MFKFGFFIDVSRKQMDRSTIDRKFSKGYEMIEETVLVPINRSYALT